MSGRGNVYSPEQAAALRVELLQAEEVQTLAQQVREAMAARWSQDLFAYDYELMGRAYRGGLQLMAEAQGLVLRFVVLDRESLAVVSRSVPLPWGDLRRPADFGADEGDEQAAALPPGSGIAPWAPPRVRLAHDEGAEAMAEPRCQRQRVGIMFVSSLGKLCGVELFSDGQDRARLAVVRFGDYGPASHVVLLLSPWFSLRHVEVADFPQ